MFDIVQLDVVHRRASDEAQIAEQLAGTRFYFLTMTNLVDRVERTQLTFLTFLRRFDEDIVRE